ncbi:PREDICTED: uncharacterized protein LOC103326558 [Prunus mume]|uniref:Uncharacterized protein LOC103326558 n=1 Tax=Prunus mume TaxID=102107 RepID=A0ABM0NMJ2_PRUMU|nr:PREDICTED: uncharacterized protein LOC103326558 [Prunus mume]
MRSILLTWLPGLMLISPPPKVLHFIRPLKNPHELSTRVLRITWHLILANLLVANHPLRRWCLMLMDILTGKTIGCGTRRGKLYYFDSALDSEIKVGQAFTTSGTRSEEERDKIWLWHKRLGTSLCIKMTRRQWKATRRTPLVLQLQIICFIMTDR